MTDSKTNMQEKVAWAARSLERMRLAKTANNNRKMRAPADPALAAWLESIPSELRDKLHDFDMIDARVATLTEYRPAQNALRGRKFVDLGSKLRKKSPKSPAPPATPRPSSALRALTRRSRVAE